MVNVNRIGNSITGSVKGETFGISYSDAKFSELQTIAKQANESTTREEYDELVEKFKNAAVEDYSATVATACPFIHVNTATGQFFLKQGDKVSVHAMPKNFVARILESIEKGIDVLPLIKFWTRLLRNPNFSTVKAKRICNYLAKTYVDYDLVEKLIKEKGVSKEIAIERATSTQTPVTQEGLLCTYKVSEEKLTRFELDEKGNRITAPRYATTKVVDPETGKITSTTATPQFVEERVFEPAVMGTRGDEFFCGEVLGHIIKVGQVHRLASWDQVDCNDNYSGQKGLHVGNLDYIRGFQNSGTETHYTFVDPMHIGAITDDGSGALRVLQYFTYDSFAGVTKSIYHSSTYAAMVDKEWEVLRAEAIERTNKLKAAQEDALASTLDVNA